MNGRRKDLIQKTKHRYKYRDKVRNKKEYDQQLLVDAKYLLTTRMR
jgi:hypothetical protein